jgi:hypothetical protein
MDGPGIQCALDLVDDRSPHCGVNLEEQAIDSELAQRSDGCNGARSSNLAVLCARASYKDKYKTGLDYARR